MATNATARRATLEEIAPLRAQLNAEAGGQIVHESLPRRAGWTELFLIELDGAPIGYGANAVAGPWQGRRTIFEFHVAPGHLSRAFALFDLFREASGATDFEVQTNHTLLTVMLHTHAHDIASEKIVFRDHATTRLPGHGAALRQISRDADVRSFMARRQGCADWALDLGGEAVATGGLCFHYNAPYADLFYEVAAPHRRRGLGAFFVQELKRAARALGAIPAARCNPDNTASRQTLQKAGFAPCGHILLGKLRPPAPSSAPSAPSTPRS